MESEVLSEAVSAPVGGMLVVGGNLVARGGPAMVAIVLVSILLLTVILWKLWRLVVSGAFRRDKAEAAVRAWTAGDVSLARGQAGEARGIRGRVVGAAFAAVSSLPEAQARAETERVARRELADLRTGFRLIELIALVAPLLGLLGTVLGMIAAFQALEASGGAADPATLAGGIWEALMTTAAGMVVAIPASLALGLFEGIEERVRIDLEDLATRIFTARSPVVLAQAAE